MFDVWLSRTVQGSVVEDLFSQASGGPVGSNGQSMETWLGQVGATALSTDAGNAMFASLEWKGMDLRSNRPNVAAVA